MLRPLLFGLLAFFSGPLLGQELGPRLAALEAPSAAERFEAERWFAAHLGEVDPARLVRALEAHGRLGHEATWRLGRALGARPGNLGMALDLLVGALEPERTVELGIEPLFDPTEFSTHTDEAGWEVGRRLGRLAVDQEVASWRSGLDCAPLSGAALELTLREERERNPWRRLEIADGSVADVVARIARSGELPVPIVLSQGLAEKLAAERFGGQGGGRLRPFRGPWDRVLLEFARVHGLAWEAVQFRGEADDELAWLRLVPRGEQGVEAGAAQLVRALEDLARRRSSAEAGGETTVSSAELQLAARFLACVEWDAALVWLGDLWESGHDGMARSALLEAASRGRVEPRLASRTGVLRLLAYARRLTGSGPAVRGHRARLEAAFARLPRLGSDGSDLAAVLVDGWQADGLSVRLLRLTGLAGMDADSAGALELARAVLAAKSGARIGEAAAVALEVLALGGPGKQLELGNPGALLALVPDTLGADELARRLALAGLAAPLDATRAATLAPASLRVLLMSEIYSGHFAAAAELLVAPSRTGGLGFGEPASWAKSCELGHMRRSFDELAAGLRGLLREGELMALRNMFTTASRLAVTANTVSADPMDLTALGLGAELSALPRLELLIGALDPAHQAALCKQLEQAGDGSPIAADPFALGILAAAPVPGARVPRQRLLKLFAKTLASTSIEPDTEILPAIESALAALWARSADGEAEALILDVATVAAGNSTHPLAQEVLFRSWPPSPK